jgi:LmbE family N-acetylglucosaminyl deacetylase
MPHALFVFAHQDDEIATATRMKHLLRDGWTISVAYLTDGMRPEVRDEESRRAHSCLGIDLSRVHFIGSEERIPDGALVDHLDRAEHLLEARIAEKVDAVYCLAWEGGHHDHDASHLLAAQFALRRGVLGSCFEMPLYHGRGMPGAIFRAFAPLRVGRPWIARRISSREGLDAAMLCRMHKSQTRTWFGLMPEAFVRLVIARREWTRPVDVARFRSRPHAGPLFYERRFGVTWEEFAEKSRTVVEAILQSAPPSRSGPC